MTAPRDWQTGPVPQGYPSYPPQAPPPFPSAPGGSPAPVSGVSPPTSPPPARRRSRAGLAAVSVLTVLLLVLLGLSIAQFVAIDRLGERLDDQGRDLAASEKRSAELQDRLRTVEQRTSGLESRTQGTLNSAAVAKKVLPSVLRVRTRTGAIGSAFALGSPPTGGGTLLVTNFHVVESSVDGGERDVLLERTGETYPATIVRTDPRKDLAVLQTRSQFPRLSPAPGQVAPGSPVVVVGSPLGLADSVTTGVVSAVRQLEEAGGRKVIQFDAAINPGNSGGPVINADGLVVGVAQAKIVANGADGLGIAIPVDQVCGDLVDC